MSFAKINFFDTLHHISLILFQINFSDTSERGTAKFKINLEKNKLSEKYKK